MTAAPSPHEHGENRGDHGRGYAKVGHREAQPDQLVQNAAETRDAKERK